MIIAVGSVKGGCGKSNTAIHIATYFQTIAPTLLVDSDRVRSCVLWSRRGKLPFTVVDEKHQAKAMREKEYKHIVFDTPGNIDDQELRELGTGSDLLVIPAIPEQSSNDGLIYTLQRLEGGGANFRVLLNRVRHNRPKRALDLRETLAVEGIAIFDAEIPDCAAFDKASELGVPVNAIVDKRADAAWEAFEALGREMHG
jgi:chromosome partitioning protein